MMCFRAVFAVLAIAAGPLAMAEDAPPPASADIPVQAYSATDLACVAWTDSCQLCLRMPDNRAVCSTPGIACTPGPLVCTRRKPE